MSEPPDSERVDFGENHGETHAPETVIFLGAGASKADGAPLQPDLFREYFQCKAIQDKVDPEMKDALGRYFQQIWGIAVDGDVSEVRFPTFEEALGLLEIAIAQGESFRGMGDDLHGTRIQELRDHLVALIGLILREKLQQGSPNHTNLVSTLNEHGLLESTAFISLNYDIIIDNALKQVTQSTPAYGVSFVVEPNPGEGRAIRLLKVHGSLNWVYCPVCNALAIFPHRKAVAELQGVPWHFRCPNCEELRVGIIIPPTFFKVMSNFYLQEIWKRAEEVLKQAGRIVFCGYSFPDADIHIRYLLKRAEVNRTGSPPQIFIVNEHKGKDDHPRELEQDRYMRFFRQKDHIHWTKLSFEQFAADPQLIEDRTQWL